MLAYIKLGNEVKIAKLKSPSNVPRIWYWALTCVFTISMAQVNSTWVLHLLDKTLEPVMCEAFEDLPCTYLGSQRGFICRPNSIGSYHSGNIYLRTYKFVCMIGPRAGCILLDMYVYITLTLINWSWCYKWIITRL